MENLNKFVEVYISDGKDFRKRVLGKAKTFVDLMFNEKEITICDYKILQLKDIKSCDYSFMDYETAKNHNFSLDDYKEVYSGSLLKNKYDENNLEELFNIFNLDRPDDFTGHSLSVSDIVELDGKKYYCDSFSWEKI